MVLQRKNNPKWKKEYLDMIHSFSNEEIYEHVMESTAGDDYEGGFTKRGEWKFVEARTLLEDRLTDWFEKDKE